MTKIHSISINNFRGIKEFAQTFYEKQFICLIGRGDSGKSTILEAISTVLSSTWNLAFYDSDFYNCDTVKPIFIECTLYELPDYFLNEKYGLYLRGINKSGDIIDDFESDEGIPAITLCLEVKDDLEPRWYITNSRPHQEPMAISATARARLNTFLISDFTDRHFSWSKGNPLYSILRKEGSYEIEDKNVVINALRKAKIDIDNATFNELIGTIENVIQKASALGVDISNAKTTIDFKDIALKDNRVCLHDESKIPFRLKGKGNKRLISLAIQLELIDNGGIILIDEIEQGLEPDRVQHIVNYLKQFKQGQVFVTTHSSNVVVELEATDFMLMRKNESNLIQINKELQGAIRKNPEAVFALKLIVCEGATEVGICRAINEFRIQQGKVNSAYKGIRFIDGSGSSFVQYCKEFNTIGFKTLVIADSDIESINVKKSLLVSEGSTIVDCENGFSIEHQIFNDLPWPGVIELVNYQIENKGIENIKQAFINTGLMEFPENWQKLEDNKAIRHCLAKASTYKKRISTSKEEDKSWFKRIDHGEFLGQIICKYLFSMHKCRLKDQIEAISSWMDND